VGFQKKTGVFWVGSNYINPEYRLLLVVMIGSSWWHFTTANHMNITNQSHD